MHACSTPSRFLFESIGLEHPKYENSSSDLFKPEYDYDGNTHHGEDPQIFGHVNHGKTQNNMMSSIMTFGTTYTFKYNYKFYYAFPMTPNERE